MRIIDNTSCCWKEICRGILKKRLVCGLYVVPLGGMILDSPAFFNFMQSDELLLQQVFRQSFFC